MTVGKELYRFARLCRFSKSREACKIPFTVELVCSGSSAHERLRGKFCLTNVAIAETELCFVQQTAATSFFFFHVGKKVSLRPSWH